MFFPRFFGEATYPNDGSIAEHLTRLSDHVTKTGWIGDWIAGGDWNETFEGSWASTMALLHDGWQGNVDLLDSSRWEGSFLQASAASALRTSPIGPAGEYRTHACGDTGSCRIIDYFMGSVEMSPLTACIEKISDHKIISTEIKIECVATQEEFHFKNLLPPSSENP